MAGYIEWIRERVGHDPIFLNAASAIITDEKGAVLLQRRGGGEKDNSWSMPGGAMDIGERAQDTVKREVHEETGLDIAVGRLVGIYTSPELVKYPNGDVCQMITQVFLCTVVGGTLLADNDETLELKYFAMTGRPTLFRAHLERALRDYELGIFGVSK